MPLVGLSWTVLRPDPRVVWWRIYGSPDGPDLKGQFLGKVPAAERTFYCDVAEGWWHFSIVAVTAQGAETPFDAAEARAEKYVTGRDTEPPAPTSLSGGFTDSDEGGLRFECDPPDVASIPHKYQVVLAQAGIEFSQGRLVAEFMAEPSHVLTDDGSRLSTFLFQMGGLGKTGSARFLVRALGAGGKPGAATELLAAFPGEPPHLSIVTVASITKSSGAIVGFPAALVTDGWSYVAGSGALLRPVPMLGSAPWANWGGILGGSGLWAKQRSAFSSYVDNAKIRTNEIDLGASVPFRLDLWDECHRASAAGRWATMPWYALSPYPCFPMEQTGRRTIPTAEGPHWLFREIGRDGRPRQPLRQVWWEVSVSDSTPVPTADANFARYTRGTWLLGRYFVARLCVVEPFGLHQIASGDVRVATIVGSRDVAGGIAGLNASGRTTKGVDAVADLIVDTNVKGLVLRSPDGDYHRLSVSNLGAITTTDLGPTKP